MPQVHANPTQTDWAFSRAVSSSLCSQHRISASVQHCPPAPAATAAEHTKCNQYTSSPNNGDVMQPCGVGSCGSLSVAADGYLRLLASACAYSAFLLFTDLQGYDLNFYQFLRRRTMFHTRPSDLIYLSLGTMLSRVTKGFGNSAQSPLLQ